MHQIDAAWPLPVPPWRRFVVCDAHRGGPDHHIDDDIMVINILNPGRKWFLEFISGSYFQNLFTVVAKTDKLEP